MVKISLLGIPHDDNSSFMKGASEAPALVRRELHSDAYSMWSETGIDFCVTGRLIDHGDIQFDSALIRGISSSGMWGAPWSQAIH